MKSSKCPTQDKSLNLATLDKKQAIAAIYETCFPFVSGPFCDTLVQEIASWTGAQTVMIQRLLSKQEYQDLKDNDEIYPSAHTVNDIHHDHSTAYAFIKACYSKISHHSLNKHSAMPLSLLPSDSPLIQTIELSEYHLIHQHNTNWIYPPFQSFVGIRVDDEDNEPVGLISVMDDKPMDTHKIDFVKSILNAVKTRVKNETERTKQRDQLIAVKNAALRDAQSKIKFLADMSHEIRTPMNAVIALTDLLLQEKSLLNEEQIEHLEVIQTSGNHLLTVINDILDISKINHDPKFKLENRRFSLRKCVKDALNMARHQASMTQHNKLVYVVECPPDIDDNVPLHQLIHQLEKLDPMIVPQKYTKKTVLPLLWKIDAHVPDYVMGDSMRLTQILLNLCSNAVKFTKSGGIRVKVALSSSQEQVYQRFKDRYDAKLETTSSKKKHVNETSAGAYNNNNNTINSNMHSEEEEEEEQEKVMLEISVTDTGIGMPADRLPRLFKSFSQIDISTARRYGGTGLGLAISSMLVNRMDGGLWVESEEGIGSRFALTVPLIAATTQKRPSSITTRRSESSGTYNSGSMIASPPSPGSSLSDGGSSVGERSHHASLETTSPSTSIGYFPLQTNNSNKRPSWDTTHIPNDPSTCHSQNLQDILTKSQETKSPPKEAKKPPRISLAKHHRKLSHSHEENFALNYPTKILLAEDNVLNQKIAISILKRLGYQDVMIASNGREVLELMREHVFDVIFMDLYMPEMDGLEATRLIISERKHNGPPPPPTTEPKTCPLLNVDDVYIIALTASASKQDRQICIDAGMNDFISKPFTMQEMRSALKNCVCKRKKRKKREQKPKE